MAPDRSKALYMETKCLSLDDGIKKMWCIYTMEHYSAIRKDKIPPFAPTWLDHENMLSKISQAERVKNHRIVGYETESNE